MPTAVIIPPPEKDSDRAGEWRKDRRDRSKDRGRGHKEGRGRGKYDSDRRKGGYSKSNELNALGNELLPDLPSDVMILEEVPSDVIVLEEVLWQVKKFGEKLN